MNKTSDEKFGRSPKKPKTGVVFTPFREKLKNLGRRLRGEKTGLSSASSVSSNRSSCSRSSAGGDERNLRRYQRFTTSISNFFQDEQLVCGAISCFGLLLSLRTEYLLDRATASEIDERRRASNSSLIKIARSGEKGDSDMPRPTKRYPDRVLGIAFLICMSMIGSTFFIFEDNNVFDENTESFDEYGDAREESAGYGSDDDDYSIRLENETQLTGSLVRTYISLAYLFLLAIYGPLTRIRTRHEIIRRRVEADRSRYGEEEEDFLYGTLYEDHYDGVCTHALCGCYPVDEEYPDEEEDLYYYDEAFDRELDDRPFDEPRTRFQPVGPPVQQIVMREQNIGSRKKQQEDCCQKTFKFFSSCCCGSVVPFRCWWQCLSVCALAQEAREVRALLPRRLQQVDYVTHQPFTQYAPRNQSYVGMSKLSKGLWVLFILTLVIVAVVLLLKENNFDLDNAMVLVATFFESFLILSVVHCIYTKSYLSIDAMTKFFSAGFLVALPTCFAIEMIVILLIMVIALLGRYAMELFRLGVVLNYLAENPQILRVTHELLNAFLVASVVEEFCKYYIFRMIDHPDLLFLSTNYRPKRKRKLGKKPSSAASANATGYKDRWPKRQKAAAVTIAMLSVATGLACAENIMYVFLRSGAEGNALEELTILGIRSIFPVHPLCAAIQSVNVIRRHIEYEGTKKANDIGVGTIVFPSVIIHGCFDAVLMIVSSFIEMADVEDAHMLSMVAWIGAFLVMLVGSIWYFWESRRQRNRLKVADVRKEAAALSWANIGMDNSSSSSDESSFGYT